MTGGAATPGVGATGSATGSAVQDYERAVRRWKLGHHCFHLYLVGMNVALDAAHVAVDRGDQAQLEKLLAELRILLDAATAAMKYTTGFRRSTYESLIRPSMSVPLVSPGFSGRLNRDHEVMLDSLKSLRTRVRAQRSAAGDTDGVEQEWRRLMSALSRNRRHHMGVCEKFVEGGTSLLAQYLEERRT